MYKIILISILFMILGCFQKEIPKSPDKLDNIVIESDYDFSFAIIGDYGKSGKKERDVANLIKRWNVNFIITTGDNNYPKGRSSTIDKNIGQYFSEYIGNYKGKYGVGSKINRFFPVLGNHDWRANTSPKTSHIWIILHFLVL